MIDFQKQKGKLHIIEQEFKQAERIEYWRQKEVNRTLWGTLATVSRISVPGMVNNTRGE